MNKISVVILNYNGEQLLRELLPLVVNYSPQAEVVVADNASTDGSLALLHDSFPTVRTIELDKNYGFAEGYNRALAQIEAEYFVLLNSDVEVTENWLNPLIEMLDEHPDILACQPKLLSYRNRNQFEYAGACGGYIDKLGYPFCRGRIFGTVEVDGGQYDEVADIFWATGACLCVRSAAFREVGGLDGRFFAHMEEIDLCWRIRARGGRIVCVPQSEVFHIGAQTLDYESPHKTYLNFRNNWLMIYKNEKHAFRVLFVRLWLDLLAALQLLCKAKPANAWAIVRAHWYFFNHRRKFRANRLENMQKTTDFCPYGRFSGSILVNYYLFQQRLARNLHM